MSEGRSRLSRVLTWLLAIILIVSVAGFVVLGVTPNPPTEPHTEFYLLGPNGTASGYEKNLTVNETGTVVVGITNNEAERTTYTRVVRLENRTIEQATFTLSAGETKEVEVTYTPQTAGQKPVEFLLYRGDTPSGEAYRRLELWLNVTAAS